MVTIVDKLIIFTKLKIITVGPPRGKRDGVIWHISRRESGNWMEKMAWMRERSIWHPAWLSKLGMNANFRHFEAWFMIYAKNMRESGISTSPWGAPTVTSALTSHFVNFLHFDPTCSKYLFVALLKSWVTVQAVVENLIKNLLFPFKVFKTHKNG